MGLEVSGARVRGGRGFECADMKFDDRSFRVDCEGLECQRLIE